MRSDNLRVVLAKVTAGLFWKNLTAEKEVVLAPSQEEKDLKAKRLAILWEFNAIVASSALQVSLSPFMIFGF